jgi:DNA-directed RNA polymerase specialized sigma24 family protein
VSTAPVASGDQFLRLLDPDPGRAREKYEQLFRRLVRFFEWRQCESPEDLAQDTIVRVLEKAARGELTINTDDVTPLFYGFAKNLLRESRRVSSRARTEELGENLSHGAADARQMEARIFLHQCLRGLASTERRLLVTYILGDRTKLRRKLMLSEGALRVAAHRVKARVRRSVGRPDSESGS